MEKFIIRKLGRRIVRKETILLIYHKKSLYSSGYGDFFVNSQQITREMKHFISILFAFLLLVGCCGEKQEKSMSITVNLRYTGTDGNATPMMDTIAKLREKYDLHMTVERFTAVDTPETENQFIRK